MSSKTNEKYIKKTQKLNIIWSIDLCLPEEMNNSLYKYKNINY